MNKEEMTMKGLEIVAYSGEARSDFLLAIKELLKNNQEKTEKLIELGQDVLKEAHIAQMDLLVAEANKDYSDLTMTMVHGQDHLMSTILLKQLIEHAFIPMQNNIKKIEETLAILVKNSK